MKEELYVTINNERSRVDLAEDSGISLEFQSNLFGSLEDVTCSHSYTFDLPFTRNNVKVFDIADDIRHASSALHTKISCEYWVNGIPIFTDGNLYISEITDEGYSCVLTWAVCSALQDLLDDDCNLNELPNQYEELNTHFATLYEYLTDVPTKCTTIDNTTDVIQPLYPANGYHPYIFTLNSKIHGHNSLGVPVVPVRYILSLIEQKYGVKVNLGADYTAEDGIATTFGSLMTADEYAEGITKYGKDYAISFGAIPLATRNITDEQAQLEKLTINASKSAVFKALGVSNCLFLDGITPLTNNAFKIMYLQENTSDYEESYVSDYAQSGYDTGAIGFPVKRNRIAFKLSGKVTAKFTKAQTEVSLKVYAYGTKYTSSGTAPTLETFEVTSVDVEDSISKGESVEFNFDDSEGYDLLSIDRQYDGNGEIYDGFFLAFSAEPSSYTMDFVVYPDTENRDTWNYVDVVSNLPEITCSEFVEFLFRSIGAFPVTKDGGLYPIYYSDIEDNLTAKNVLDWSKKLTGAPHARPESIALSIDDCCQHNYFLMKNDDLEQTESERLKEDDVYYRGYGDITIADATLDDENETYTAPFQSAYEKDNNCPRITTGANIKAWNYDLKEKTNTRCDVEATYGLLMKGFNTYVTFQVFMPFTLDGALNNSESFRYMQSILAKPYVITEHLMLNEIDLANLDYAKPIYLDKYNSYFVIVSISRGSDGVSECKLLKI